MKQLTPQRHSQHPAMRQILGVFAAIFIGFLLPGISDAQDPPSGYEEAWSDEFDGSSVDITKWQVADTWITTNNSLQDYHPDAVTVESGNLVITSENIASRGRDYRSGQVISRALQKHGRWDIRAKLPTSTGMWPAIWLLSDELWPTGGEIDILENRGNEPTITSSAFHYGTNPPFNPQFRAQEQQTIRNGQAVNYHQGFHKYSVEWDNDQVRYFVDDVHHFTVRDDDVGGFLSQEIEPMRLIINTAIGGSFLDDPDNSTIWPQRFEIDYVRAYTRTADPRSLAFDNGSFEEQGGSLAQWSTFGSTIGNVGTGHEFINGGSESLKLFGQFNDAENFSGVEQGMTVEAGQELRIDLEAFISAGDSLAGTDNEVFLKIDYYSALHGLFGSDEYISSDSILIGDADSLTNLWNDFELESTAPDGAVEARLAIVFAQRNNGGGAIYIDNISFIAVPEPGTVGLLALVGIALASRRRR